MSKKSRQEVPREPMFVICSVFSVFELNSSHSLAISLNVIEKVNSIIQVRDIANMENQSEIFRKFMKYMEIYRRTSANQPSPAETLSCRDAEVEPATRHPATYCQPVPSGSSSTTTFDPCVVCKGKHPLWKCVVFKKRRLLSGQRLLRTTVCDSRALTASIRLKRLPKGD